MPCQRSLLVSLTVLGMLVVTGCRQTGVRGGMLSPAAPTHTPYETPIPSGGSALPPAPAASLPFAAPRFSSPEEAPPPIPPAALGGGFTLPKFPVEAETETASKEVDAEEVIGEEPATLEAEPQPDEPLLPPMPEESAVESEETDESEEVNLEELPPAADVSLEDLPPAPGSELEMPADDEESLELDQLGAELVEPFATAVQLPMVETKLGPNPTITPRPQAAPLKEGVVERWPVGGFSSDVTITPGPASVPAAMQKPRRLPEEPRAFKAQPMTLWALPAESDATRP